MCTRAIPKVMLLSGSKGVFHPSNLSLRVALNFHKCSLIIIITYTFKNSRLIYLPLAMLVFAVHWLFHFGGKQGLLSSCSAQASHCRGLSCCGAQALGRPASAVAAPGL